MSEGERAAAEAAADVAAATVAEPAGEPAPAPVTGPATGATAATPSTARLSRIGIRDVATAAGVASGTVSHYLNYPDKVSPEKAARIREAIERLGFVRNDAGRQLRLGHSSTIAYLVPDVANPFFSLVAEGVEQRAREAGLVVLLANSGREAGREDTYLAHFQEHRVRGMLVASYGTIEDRLAAVRERGTPVVLVGKRAQSPDQPSVSIDEEAGGYLAARHLLDLGRRRIAFVGGPTSVEQVANRLAGARRAVAEQPDAALEVIDVAQRVIREGHEVAAALLARDPGQRPDAVFTANDLLAIGMAHTLVSHGLAIPEQLALIGYDDIEYAENAVIPISSIRPPHRLFGATAVELLLDAIEGVEGRQPVHRGFIPELIVRESTAGPAAG